MRSLQLPSDSVNRTLSGDSHNMSTTCTVDHGTGGPDDFYTLHVPSQTGIVLSVSATIDTALAIRRTCDMPLSELACNDNANPGSPTGAQNPLIAVRKTLTGSRLWTARL